jgi:hypothetical protein
MPKKVPKQFLGAFKHGHRKGVREYIDEELSIQLLARVENGDKKALEALEWITKYNNETYRGVLKKNDPEAIHNNDKLYKEASDAHNARRRDLLCNLHSGKVQGQIINASENPALFDIYVNKSRNLESHESSMIDLMSPKAKKKMEIL